MSEDNRDYEAEARADGWQPKEEFKGPEGRWVDAKTFVENGERILPIVNAKLRKALAGIDELREGNRQFREFHEQTVAAAKRERDKAIADLEAARTRAVTEGNGEDFAKADRELTRLREAPAERPRGPSPDMQAWLNENAWYTTDPELAAVADGLSDVVKRDNPHLTGRAFMEKVTEKTRAMVPHKFSNERRSTSTTEGNRPPPPPKREKGYDDLPPEAKAACEKFVRQFPGYTREQYLADYVWSQQ